MAAGAPLSARIFDTIRAISAVPFDNYYGQTEVGVISFGETGDAANCIGPPVSMRMVKLVDVPKLGYLSTDMENGRSAPRGELMAYKPYFLGYFRNPELTRTKIEGDGWIHSGDICQFNEDGTLTILSRIGNVIKNSRV